MVMLTQAQVDAGARLTSASYGPEGQLNGPAVTVYYNPAPGVDAYCIQWAPYQGRGAPVASDPIALRSWAAVVLHLGNLAELPTWIVAERATTKVDEGAWERFPFSPGTWLVVYDERGLYDTVIGVFDRWCGLANDCVVIRYGPESGQDDWHSGAELGSLDYGLRYRYREATAAEIEQTQAYWAEIERKERDDA